MQNADDFDPFPDGPVEDHTFLKSVDWKGPDTRQGRIVKPLLVPISGCLARSRNVASVDLRNLSLASAPEREAIYCA
jgi:hypothetical protein